MWRRTQRDQGTWPFDATPSVSDEHPAAGSANCRLQWRMRQRGQILTNPCLQRAFEGVKLRSSSDKSLRPLSETFSRWTTSFWIGSGMFHDDRLEPGKDYGSARNGRRSDADRPSRSSYRYWKGAQDVLSTRQPLYLPAAEGGRLSSPLLDKLS